MCAYCRRRERHNREKFSGNREAVLRRDGYQCQLCGELDPRSLVVHHRYPGRHRPKHLVTLCRRCHARVHHTLRPSYGFVAEPLRRVLWREAHRGLAEQEILLREPEPPVQSEFDLSSDTR